MFNENIFKLNWPALPEEEVKRITQLVNQIDPTTLVNTNWGDYIYSLPGSNDICKDKFGVNFKSSGIILDRSVNGRIYTYYKQNFYPDIDDKTMTQVSIIDTNTIPPSIFGPFGVVENLITTRSMLPVCCTATLNQSEKIRLYQPKDHTAKPDQIGTWNCNDIELVDEMTLEKNEWYAIDYKNILIEEVPNPAHSGRIRVYVAFYSLKNLDYFLKQKC